jgi:arylsulfatase A-like enzyme
VNVLLITIDSMRADMPWQGYERPIAPNLTKLAAESVVYENAYSVSSYTAKSVGALLAGRYPSTLWRGHTFFTRYSKANQFFPELLQQGGVRTMAGQAHLYFDRNKNLSQGFDLWKLAPGLTWNASTDESITSDKMTKLAIDLLSEENTKGPFFMWLHYMDPHDQYMQHEGTPKWGRNNRDRYDSEMHFTDKHVGALLAHVNLQPWSERTAIIISADHGEAFGEHKMFKHAFALWDVLTHVPLLIKAPGAKPKRIKERRSHIDLAPTIMDLLGQPAHSGFVGKTMVPELYGSAAADDREPILLELPADSHNPPTKALLKGDFKLIIDEAAPRYRLFNLTKDPDERRDLAKDSRFKDKLAEMKKLAEDAWSKHPFVKPFGGKKVVGGLRANGPEGPDGYKDDGKPLP